MDPEGAPREEQADGEDDESWPRIAAGLLVRSVQLFVLYLGPPFILLSCVLGARADDPVRPCVAAGVLALAWGVNWLFFLPDGEQSA